MNGHTLVELARLVNGRILGDETLSIADANSLNKAGPGEIAFAVDERNIKRLNQTRAAACLIPEKFAGHEALQSASCTLVAVADPLDAFLKILQLFRPQPARRALGISPVAHVDPQSRVGAGTTVFPGAFIDEDVIIGERCDIYPGVFIGRGCRIGNDCVLYPNVTLYTEVTLKDRVVLHAGAVLGADGFGYRFRGGKFEKIPQLGSVTVEDDCEIGANTTIDRGMIGPTVVGAGTKLDNQVMIGHNCELGKHNVFASQVGLAGSVTTGDYVRMAGQVGVADHVHLGKGSTLGAKSGVHKDIPDGETHVGYPARPEMEEMKIVMATARTPEMRKQLRDLENRLALLERQLANLTTAAPAA